LIAWTRIGIPPQALPNVFEMSGGPLLRLARLLLHFRDCGGASRNMKHPAKRADEKIQF